MNLIALPLLSFFDDLSLIILILVAFMLYKWMKDFAPSPTIALMITLIIVLLLLWPNVWFRYLMFVVVILGPFLGAKPAEGGGGGGGHH